jgi:cell division protein ZapA
MGKLMAHVNVVINGRQYRMACEDGQEDHLLQLATDFDRRIGKMREDFGQIGDMRLTVMAALMLADEFSDVSKRVARLEQEVSGLQDAGATASERTQQTQAAISAALNAAAERIEGVTRSLNGSVGKGVALG